MVWIAADADAHRDDREARHATFGLQEEDQATGLAEAEVCYSQPFPKLQGLARHVLGKGHAVERLLVDPPGEDGGWLEIDGTEITEHKVDMRRRPLQRAPAASSLERIEPLGDLAVRKPPIGEVPGVQQQRRLVETRPARDSPVGAQRQLKTGENTIAGFIGTPWLKARP